MLDEPKNLDAEQATLGAILRNRDAILSVASWLKPEAFWLPKHRQAYAAAIDLLYRGVPPDIRTVSDELRRRGQLDGAGGVEYLDRLDDAVVSSYHIDHYAREVERCWRLRRIIRAGERLVQIGMEYGAGADDAEAEALSATSDLAATGGAEAVVHIAETVETIVASLADGEPPCISTGFADLDAILGGLYASDFILLAARPGVGKTAAMLSMAHRIAMAGHPVLVFSLEMSREQLVQRLAAAECRISTQQLRRRSIPRHLVERFAETMRRLGALPIHVCDLAGQSPATVRATVMQHLREFPGAVVMIDYLQLMQDRRKENRQQEVSDISRSLKILARDAKVPLIALSQLSRAVEGRSVKVPQLSDLRESGALEQDSDIVIFIHREELYEPTSEKKGVAELHIAKHRNGPLGVVPLRFDAATTSFHDLSYRDMEGS